MSKFSESIQLPIYDNDNIREEDIFMAYAIYIFKGNNMSLNKILVKSPSVLTFVEKYSNIFMKNITCHLVVNMETPYVENDAPVNQKVFFDWLLKNILYQLLIKLHVSTLFGIEIKIEKIYKDILTVYSFSYLDYPKNIDKSFMESFFEIYDPFFEIRSKFSEYSPLLKERECFNYWADIYNNCANHNIKFKKLNIKKEVTDYLPQNDLFTNQIFNSYSSVTTINYINRKIDFEDEDSVSSEDIFNIKEPCIFDINITDFAKTIEQCDCAKPFCNGCYDCPSCRKKTCKIICREKLIFNYHDIFKNEIKKQLKSELDARDYFINLKKKKRGRQASKNSLVISSVDDEVSFRLEEKLFKNNDDNLEDIMVNNANILNFNLSNLLSFSINSN